MFLIKNIKNAATVS